MDVSESPVVLVAYDTQRIRGCCCFSLSTVYWCWRTAYTMHFPMSFNWICNSLDFDCASRQINLKPSCQYKALSLFTQCCERSLSNLPLYANEVYIKRLNSWPHPGFILTPPTLLQDQGFELIWHPAECSKLHAGLTSHSTVNAKLLSMTSVIQTLAVWCQAYGFLNFLHLSLHIFILNFLHENNLPFTNILAVQVPMCQVGLKGVHQGVRKPWNLAQGHSSSAACERLELVPPWLTHSSCQCGSQGGAPDHCHPAVSPQLVAPDLEPSRELFAAKL